MDNKETLYDEDEYFGMHHECPYCGLSYDEIDFEYQICKYCKHEANSETTIE